MRLFVFCGISGFFAVFFGAFGSHVLKASLGEKFFSVFQTANQYHFYHTLALLAVSTLKINRPQKFFTASVTAFICGLALFSGSLYLYAIYQTRALAMVAPLGGASFMMGWLFFTLGCIREFGKKNG